MADAATYSAQASSIYDPQQSADAASLAAENKASQVSYTTDTNAAQSAYAAALAGNQKATDSAIARDNFTASTHGLWSSGLAANGIHATNQAYLDNSSKIELARAQKLTDIASRRTANDTGYQAKTGALTSKYLSAKNTYIADHMNADARQAAQEQAASQRQAASDARYASRQAAKAPTGYGMTRNTSKTNTDPIGSLSFHGPNGQPISIGSYYSALGGSTQDMANTLSNGTPDDQNIANDIKGVDSSGKQVHAGLSADQIKSKYARLFQ